MKNKMLNWESERLIFKDLSKKYIPEVALFFADAQSRKFAENSPADHTEAALARIAAQQARYQKFGLGLCALELKSSGRFVGHCGLLHQTAGGREELEIGYHLQPEFRGRGFAAEAARAAADFAFRKLGIESVISLIAPENSASESVAKNYGAVFENKVIFREKECLLYRLLRVGF